MFTSLSTLYTLDLYTAITNCMPFADILSNPFTSLPLRYTYPDRAPLKEVLGGQYNYREGGRQVLRQGAKGRRRSRKCQCSKDPCAQKVSGGRTDPSPKYRWKVHG